MRASEVMTHPPICCSRQTSVRNAARMLRKSDIGMLPVVDELWGRRLMGVVTDRDLCLFALTEEHDPALRTVEDCMATDVVTCTPETDVRAVVAVMIDRRVRRVPIVDKDNSVLGVIGISDLIAHDAVGPEEIFRLLSRIMGSQHLVHSHAA